jgi:hypothetical protein
MGRKYDQGSIMGHSDPSGKIILGNITVDIPEVNAEKHS